MAIRGKQQDSTKNLDGSQIFQSYNSLLDVGGLNWCTGPGFGAKARLTGYMSASAKAPSSSRHKDISVPDDDRPEGLSLICSL